MALWESLSMLSEISVFKKRYDNDYIDRVNHRYSLYAFLILGLVTGAREYMDSNIHCWAPAEFPLEWIEYTNRMCWISNTYYVPIDERIPDKDENKEYRIAYYQWVTLVIFLQAALFIVPSMIWKSFNKNSGIHLSKIVELVEGAENRNDNIRERTISYIVKNLDRGLRSQNEYRAGCLYKVLHGIARNVYVICGKRYGNYLTSLYLFVKLMYLCNSVGQLFLLNLFLGGNYYLYGYEAVSDLFHGRNWTTSYRFPRVTLCDFQIRSLGNRIHHYTVQCVLPANLFNEKIYLFIWYWLVALSIANIASFISWMWTLFSQNRRQYVSKYLKIMERNRGKERASMPSKAFCEKYLKQDGLFVLRLIEKNTNGVVVGEIIQEMWENYQRDKLKEDPESV